MHLLCLLVCVCVFPSVCVMAELPSGLLEACVVVGSPSDKLRDIYQVQKQKYVHAVCKQTERVYLRAAAREQNSEG